jgi:hypothetical protein
MFGGGRRNTTNTMRMKTMDERLISFNRYQLRIRANRHRKRYTDFDPRKHNRQSRAFANFGELKQLPREVKVTFSQSLHDGFKNPIQNIGDQFKNDLIQIVFEYHLIERAIREFLLSALKSSRSKSALGHETKAFGAWSSQ